MDDTLLMLKELTDASGLPGYEFEVRGVIRKYLEPISEVSQDNLGSIIGKKRGTRETPRIMLAGHMDEIGFMVTTIDKDGFLRFQPLGGWWEQVMLAQQVVVKTSGGDIPGIIGSKPPHLIPQDERKKMVEKQEMFIDIGASSKEEALSWGVKPGDPVVPASSFRQMRNGDLLMAKAWDDRIGCALFIDVLRKLQGKAHPNTVFGVGTVQEEVGLRGAVTSSFDVNPDVGFALEVAIAGDTPGIKEHESQSKLGGGPAILIYDASLVPNVRLRDLTVQVAKDHGIPYQFDFMPGGSTDAGRIQLQARGVPSLVIGVPARYIHSHTGIIHRKDYDNTVRLLIELIMRLDDRTVLSLVE